MERLIAVIVARRQAWVQRLRRLAGYLETTRPQTRKGKSK